MKKRTATPEPVVPAEPRDADAIALDVDRGVEVVAQIGKLKEELNGITARLTADALMRPDEHEPLKDADREGRQYLAVGSRYELPLIITADKIVGQFQLNSPTEKRILTRLAAIALEDKLPFFFQKVTVWEGCFDDGKEFRAAAAEHLGEHAPAFIAACVARDKDGIPKSDIKIAWESAAAHTELKEAAAAS